MNNFLTRSLSGIIYVALIIWAILCQNQLVFRLVFALLFVWATCEFHILTNKFFRQNYSSFKTILYTVFGQIYITLPFLVMFGIYQIPLFLLSIFVIIWANDTFAYLVGSWLGKHKICPKISPKKSWEGFAGGLLGSLVAGSIFSLFVKDLSLWQWFAFALIISIVGTTGDFFESFIKRKVGVKDSGNLIPGHGGLLDRLDSMLFAAPAAFILLNMMMC